MNESAPQKQSNVRTDISKLEVVSSFQKTWLWIFFWNCGLKIDHATGVKLIRHKKRKGKTTPVVVFCLCVHGRCLSISSSYLLLRWWLILEDILFWSIQQKCNIVTDTSCMVPSPHSWCPRGGTMGWSTIWSWFLGIFSQVSDQGPGPSFDSIWGLWSLSFKQHRVRNPGQR